MSEVISTKPSSPKPIQITDTSKNLLKSNMFIPASLTRKTNQSSKSAFNLETGMMMPMKKSKVQPTAHKNTTTCQNDGSKNKEVLKNPFKSLVSSDLEDSEDEGDECQSSSYFFSVRDDKTDEANPAEDEKTLDDELKDNIGPQLPDSQDAPLQFKQTERPYGHAAHYTGYTHPSAHPSMSTYEPRTSDMVYSNEQYNMANMDAGDNVAEESETAGGSGQSNYMADEQVQTRIYAILPCYCEI